MSLTYWPTKQVLFYGIEYTLLELHKSIAGLFFKLNDYVQYFTIEVTRKYEFPKGSSQFENKSVNVH